jgi:hypothetical protein
MPALSTSWRGAAPFSGCPTSLPRLQRPFRTPGVPPAVCGSGRGRRGARRGARGRDPGFRADRGVFLPRLRGPGSPDVGGEPGPGLLPVLRRLPDRSHRSTYVVSPHLNHLPARRAPKRDAASEDSSGTGIRAGRPAKPTSLASTRVVLRTGTREAWSGFAQRAPGHGGERPTRPVGPRLDDGNGPVAQRRFGRPLLVHARDRPLSGSPTSLAPRPLARAKPLARGLASTIRSSDLGAIESSGPFGSGSVRETRLRG